ncbi:hypothetical protein PQX77_020253 [Marasmius sp. AFHP31]|nr:hypothetical protein PQX77_020253 [Marasmius sp. AFHP31]
MSAPNTRFKNVTFDDRDSLHFHYDENGWYNKGTWSSPRAHKSGTMSSSEQLNASVTFTFPKPAVAFYYYGLGRAFGGLYGICIDCDPSDMRFEPVDALNRSDDGGNPPVVLFSKRFDIPGTHVIVLTNTNDTRVIPSGASQITVTQFVLEIDDSPQSSTQEPASISSSTTATSESRTTTITNIPPSLTQSPSEEPNSPSSASAFSLILPPPSSSSNFGDATNSTAPVAIIAGAVGGIFTAVILIVVGLCYFHRKRARDAVVNGPMSSPSGPFHSSPLRVNASRSPLTANHSFLSFDSSVFSASHPDALAGALDGPEAAITPWMRWNLSSSFWRHTPSHVVIDNQRSPRTSSRPFLARLNLLRNYRPTDAGPNHVTPFSQMHPAISKEERPKAGSSPFDHSGTGSRRLLEVDASPFIDRNITESGGTSILPPLYDQVFNRSRVGVR